MSGRTALALTLFVGGWAASWFSVEVCLWMLGFATGLIAATLPWTEILKLADSTEGDAG